MWIHGKGLTFIECIIAVVIVVLFLVVVLPVFSRNEINFREENLNTNLSRLRERVGAYRRDHGGFSRGFPRGENGNIGWIYDPQTGEITPDRSGISG